MAHAFTTSFDFNGKTYSTVVDMTVKEKELAISFHIPDESLHYLLPNGQMTYNSRNGLMKLNAKEKALAQELVGCMVRAVENHISI